MVSSGLSILGITPLRALRFSAALLFSSSISEVQAAGYYMIPRSMTYNTDKFQDEYVAYLMDNTKSTISKCKATYSLTDNILTSQACTDSQPIPFSPSIGGGTSPLSTIVFTRASNHGDQPVLGPEGMWRLDQATGKVEFCVFGDITPKCVVLNPS